jgi:mRNA interferase MazF
LTPQRGELWWATLDPILGSEQAGRRPVLIFQNNSISQFTTTFLAIPLTTTRRRAQLPSAVFIPAAGTGLPADSVALCHQTRVLDQTRLHARLGAVTSELLQEVADALLFTLGIFAQRT